MSPRFGAPALHVRGVLLHPARVAELIGPPRPARRSVLLAARRSSPGAVPLRGVRRPHGDRLLQGRGIGTVAGTVLYEIWRLAWRGFDRAGARGASRRSRSSRWSPRTPGKRTLDRFHLLEPALSFLEAGEQAFLAERFGFDGLKWGRISAIFLLVAVGPFAVSALLGFLLVPQTSDLFSSPSRVVSRSSRSCGSARWPRRRPAPSILGVLVRPAARRLLDRTPLE